MQNLIENIISNTIGNLITIGVSTVIPLLIKDEKKRIRVLFITLSIAVLIIVGIALMPINKDVNYQRYSLNVFLSNFVEGEQALTEFDRGKPNETIIMDFLYSNAKNNFSYRFEERDGDDALSSAYIDQKLLPYYFFNVRLSHPVSNQNSLSGFRYEDGYYLWKPKDISSINTLAIMKKVTSAPNNTLKVDYDVYKVVNTQGYQLQIGTNVPDFFYDYTVEQAQKDTLHLSYLTSGVAIVSQKSETKDDTSQNFLLHSNTIYQNDS